MPTMGAYCKAIPLKMFRSYPGWREDLQNLRAPEDSEEKERRRDGLADDDFLYLQEDFSVTDGIFLAENVVFNSDTEEWREFCKSTLKFDPDAARNAD